MITIPLLKLELTKQTISILKLTHDSKQIVAVDLDGKIILIQTMSIHHLFNDQSDDDMLNFWIKNVCVNQFEYMNGVFDTEIIDKFISDDFQKNICELKAHQKADDQSNKYFYVKNFIYDS